MTAPDEVEIDEQTVQLDPLDTPEEPDGTEPDGTDAVEPPTLSLTQQERRRLVRTFAAILAAVVLIAGALIFALIRDRSELRDSNAALRRSLEIARGDAGEQIQQLEDDNAALAAQVQALLQDLVDTQLEVDELDITRQELVDELATTGDELVAEQERTAELQSELDAVGPSITPMPDLLGVPIEEAQQFADDIGAELIVELARPAGVTSPPGKVIEQVPAEGVTVVPGSAIWVQVYGEPVAG
jgi:hypothetical protein